MPNPVDRTLRMTNNSSFEFFRAITRCPAASIVDGLRAKDTGTPVWSRCLPTTPIMSPR